MRRVTQRRATAPEPPNGYRTTSVTLGVANATYVSPVSSLYTSAVELRPGPPGPSHPHKCQPGWQQRPPPPSHSPNRRPGAALPKLPALRSGRRGVHHVDSGQSRAPSGALCSRRATSPPVALSTNASATPARASNCAVTSSSCPFRSRRWPLRRCECAGLPPFPRSSGRRLLGCRTGVIRMSTAPECARSPTVGFAERISVSIRSSIRLSPPPRCAEREP